MKATPIQTGLRVPESLHDNLLTRAEKKGVSLNSLILMYIGIAMTLEDNGFIRPDKSE